MRHGVMTPLGVWRLGSGKRPSSPRRRRTLLRPGRTTSFISSPTIRRTPQPAFSRASRRIICPRDSAIGGRVRASIIGEHPLQDVGGGALTMKSYPRGAVDRGHHSHSHHQRRRIIQDSEGKVRSFDDFDHRFIARARGHPWCRLRFGPPCRGRPASPSAARRYRGPSRTRRVVPSSHRPY